MISSRRRSQWRWTTSCSPRSRSSARNIEKIGVTPLPALSISTFAGAGSGKQKVPSTSPRNTIVPGRTSLVKNGDMRPPSTRRTEMLSSPEGWSVSEVIV